MTLTKLEYKTLEKPNFDYDIIDEVIYSINGKDISLYKLIDTLGISESKPYDDSWIHLSLESENGITKTEFFDLLKTKIAFEK